VEPLLAEHPFFEGLDPSVVRRLRDCATLAHFQPGEYVLREGGAADTFYLVHHGAVAVGIRTPTEDTILDTVRDGEMVGWSWIVPPYRWTFDARATEATSTVALDAACLRLRCETDPALGYALLRRVVPVMSRRLRSARVRLLDLYGAGP
jgi:CRP-like cAMP-binding protein